VVTLVPLEVVDRWMASPASIEAPVQREDSMNVTQYDPLREAMQQMRHQLFHQHFEQPFQETQGTGGGWSPLVDVFEDDEGITLKVELPEVDANDVDIQLEGNALTLRGERKLENVDKQEGYHRVERSYGAFSRMFTLPSIVEMGNVTAQSRDGVLRIFLPKKAEMKPRQIKVQTDLSLGGLGKQKEYRNASARREDQALRLARSYAACGRRESLPATRTAPTARAGRPSKTGSRFRLRTMRCT
jgi:HSP20 family protein